MNNKNNSQAQRQTPDTSAIHNGVVRAAFDDDYNFSLLYFDFGFAKLFTYGDGSGKAESIAISTLEAQTVQLRTVKQIGYAGSKFQPEFPELAYNLQDEVIARYGNLEHAALHLWIDAARADDFLRSPTYERKVYQSNLELLEAASGVNEEILEEGFVTHIQLLANGIQPDATRTGELEVANGFLGLAPVAITAALAFVAFFRAQMRKTYGARIASEQEHNQRELEELNELLG